MAALARGCMRTTASAIGSDVGGGVEAPPAAAKFGGAEGLRLDRTWTRLENHALKVSGDDGASSGGPALSSVGPSATTARAAPPDAVGGAAATAILHSSDWSCWDSER
jgi:hypothetical protein